MKLPIRIFLIFLLFSCTKQIDDTDLTITNINIIDPVNQQIIPDQTILIKDGIISDVLSSDNDFVDNLADSLTIDGTDKYIVSGFWNMHTHITWKDDLDESLFPI